MLNQFHNFGICTNKSIYIWYATLWQRLQTGDVLIEFSMLVKIILISGEIGSSNEEICGASAHSDYGMITLLATDGVRGLQVIYIFFLIDWSPPHPKLFIFF